MSGLREAYAAVAVVISGLRYRAAMSLSTVAGIALVTMVLIAFLAMASGLERTLSSTGSANVALVIGKGAKSETSSTISLQDALLLQQQLDQRIGDGRVVASAETTIIVPLEAAEGETVGMILRGVDQRAFKVRPNLRIVSGRMFRSATNEIVVGNKAAADYKGLQLGKTIRLGANQWVVVGVFDAGNSAFGSETWADLASVRMSGPDGTGVSSIRIPLSEDMNRATIEDLLTQLADRDLDVVSEQQFFASQANGLVTFIKGFGWPVAIVMAIGALVGALNTMFSSVEERARDIATLRAIGFRRRSGFVATFLESLTLSAMGALLGIGIAHILFDGFAASTLAGGMSQLGFSLDVDGATVAKAFVLAVVIGGAGGLWPAWRGARQPILKGLEAGSNG